MIDNLLIDENKKNENEIFPSSPINKKSLNIVNAKLTIKTRVARFYFYKGGDKEGIGLPLFAKQVGSIWHAASQDDPYADLFLLRIYDALTKTRQELDEKTKYYDGRIIQAVKFDRDVVLKDEPHVVTLRFATSYGYMAANLIADLDNYAYVLYSAKVLGVALDKTIQALLQEAGEKIKYILMLPFKWVQTGVTREDILNKSEKASEAFTAMGELNQLVVNRLLRAPYAPKIDLSKKNFDE